jgi:hypothetical protein
MDLERRCDVDGDTHLFLSVMLFFAAGSSEKAIVISGIDESVPTELIQPIGWIVNELFRKIGPELDRTRQFDNH